MRMLLSYEATEHVAARLEYAVLYRGTVQALLIDDIAAKQYINWRLSILRNNSRIDYSIRKVVE